MHIRIAISGLKLFLQIPQDYVILLYTIRWWVPWAPGKTSGVQFRLHIPRRECIVGIPHCLYWRMTVTRERNSPTASQTLPQLLAIIHISWWQPLGTLFRVATVATSEWYWNALRFTSAVLKERRRKHLQGWTDKELDMQICTHLKKVVVS